MVREILILLAAIVGAAVLGYVVAGIHWEQRVATSAKELAALKAELQRVLASRREAGIRTYAHGVEMGMAIRPSFVRDGKLEHWAIADEQTMISALTSHETFQGDE